MVGPLVFFPNTPASRIGDSSRTSRRQGPVGLVLRGLRATGHRRGSGSVPGRGAGFFHQSRVAPRRPDGTGHRRGSGSGGRRRAPAGAAAPAAPGQPRHAAIEGYKGAFERRLATRLLRSPFSFISHPSSFAGAQRGPGAAAAPVAAFLRQAVAAGILRAKWWHAFPSAHRGLPKSAFIFSTD